MPHLSLKGLIAIKTKKSVVVLLDSMWFYQMPLKKSGLKGFKQNYGSTEVCHVNKNT